jgi:hypothetical protein
MPLKNLGSNSVQAAYFRIKFKDIFNLKQFYTAMHEWLLEYEWSSVDSQGKLENKDFWETLFLERIIEGGAKEGWWWWRMQRIPGGNSYYKYHLDLDFHPLYITDTEVMRDGKKFKANKGEIEVKLWAYIEFDYKGEWSKHPILKVFNKVFPKRIFKDELYESHKLELYRECYILNAFIKKWMKLRSFLPFEEITLFPESGAYPQWQKS